MLTPFDVLKLYPAHDGTLAAALAARVRVAGEREFLLFQGRSYSYAQVQEETRRTAALLHVRGVAPGMRVSVMSLNHPSTVFTLLALAHLGAVMVPINPDYGVNEAGYVLEHAQVCGVIASPDALPTVRAALAKMDTGQTTAKARPWLMLNAPAATEDARGLPVLGEEAQRITAAAPPPAADPQATCVFIYTSGTTGFPKGVMHAQKSLITAGEGFVERMYLQPDERLLCVLPMFHVNAIFYSFAGALAAGATLILEPRFSASKFWQVVKDTRATEVNTIAAAASILMRRSRGEFVPGHQLRKMYGAPFDEETYRIWQQEFGVATLIEGYGMSEVPGALSNPFPGPHKVRSMGRPSRHPDPAVSLAQLRIADDDGHFLPAGQTGELVVKTPIVMQGYFRDEAQTSAAFRDGWFLTGDLAYADEDGYFWFVARKKDIIRKRGENISGAELDRVVGNHPAVLEAAAIPVPADLGEDDILIAVVPRPGMQVSAREIEAWCRQHLAPIKAPRYVAVVESLPHTPTHRVAKFKMREDESLKARAVDLLARDGTP
jgi:crotonobetaine/carnitine-CoA ligase